MTKAENKYFNLNGYNLTVAQTVITTSQLDELLDKTISKLISDIVDNGVKTDDVAHIGKIKFYIDLYTECASILEDECIERQAHIKNYQSILRGFQYIYCLTEDDMSDVFNDYFDEFIQKVETVLTEYREKYDYNDPNDFIEAMYEFDNLDVIEQQLINDIYLSTINVQ